MRGTSRRSAGRLGDTLRRWGAMRGVRVAAVVVFFYATFLGVLLAYSANPFVPVDLESTATARSLAHHGSFADPFFSMKTGPTAHLSPVFPAYVAVVLRVFGEDGKGAGVLSITAALAVAVQLTLLPFVTEEAGIGLAPGILAALLWLWGQLSTNTFWEASYSGALIVLTTFSGLRLLRRGAANTRAIVSHGLLWGLLLFTCPPALPVFLAWAVFLLVGKAISTTRAQKIALLLAPAVVLAPWTVRNWETFHTLMFVRDNLGMELAVSNNDCAQFGELLTIRSGCSEREHPDLSAAQAALLRRMGEAAYNRMRLHTALGWIAAHPRRFAVLTLQRAFVFWFPTDGGNPIVRLRYNRYWRPTAAIYATTLLAIPGLALLWRKSRRLAFLLVLWLALFPPVYYLVYFENRYRYPILWVTFLLAGYAIERAFAAAARLAWKRIGAAKMPGAIESPELGGECG